MTTLSTLLAAMAVVCAVVPCEGGGRNGARASGGVAHNGAALTQLESRLNALEAEVAAMRKELSAARRGLSGQRHNVPRGGAGAGARAETMAKTTPLDGEHCMGC